MSWTKCQMTLNHDPCQNESSFLWLSTILSLSSDSMLLGLFRNVQPITQWRGVHFVPSPHLIGSLDKLSFFVLNTLWVTLPKNSTVDVLGSSYPTCFLYLSGSDLNSTHFDFMSLPWGWGTYLPGVKIIGRTWEKSSLAEDLLLISRDSRTSKTREVTIRSRCYSRWFSQKKKKHRRLKEKKSWREVYWGGQFFFIALIEISLPFVN